MDTIGAAFMFRSPSKSLSPARLRHSRRVREMNPSPDYASGSNKKQDAARTLRWQSGQPSRPPEISTFSVESLAAVVKGPLHKVLRHKDFRQLRIDISCYLQDTYINDDDRSSEPQDDLQVNRETTATDKRAGNAHPTGWMANPGFSTRAERKSAREHAPNDSGRRVSSPVRNFTGGNVSADPKFHPEGNGQNTVDRLPASVRVFLKRAAEGTVRTQTEPGIALVAVGAMPQLQDRASRSSAVISLATCCAPYRMTFIPLTSWPARCVNTRRPGP
jgi:hypothetical protein